MYRFTDLLLCIIIIFELSPHEQCDVCDRYFQGNDQFNIHVSSRKHKSVVQASRRKTKNMNNVSNIVRSALVGVKCVVESSLSVDTCANDNALHEECDVKRGKEKEE